VNRKVVFDPAAISELLQAADFYDHERCGLGSEFLDSIERALSVIADDPAAFPIEKGMTRQYVVARFPYVIMYWFDENSVVVTAIAHHRRRPRYWGDRL
jgi:plasmid stabilization system protein ParE